VKQDGQRVRQAVVIVHGMGEQRPLDTLNGFIGAALDAGARTEPEFHSRPDDVTDSYESRRYLARARRSRDGVELNAQTEFYEFHWAHLMQGNRLQDLWPTFRRFIVLLPWHVPAGLRVVWAIFWGLAIALIVIAIQNIGPDFDPSRLNIANFVAVVVGNGLLALIVTLALTYLLTRFTPRWLTSSFVDVARYLDTSPRSYAVRKDIRAGMVNLLRGLHQAQIRGKPRYQRIVIVAHSLGTYIAYDAITYLWGQMNELHQGPMDTDQDAVGAAGGIAPEGLEEIERAAASVGPNGEGADAYRAAQRVIWRGLRAQGNPWLVTDFISFGSPMYFADRLMTLNPDKFRTRVDRRDFPTCPPQADEGAPGTADRRRLSYNNGGRRVLYHGAPFAVVRWTNFWFPPRLWFFGDWFAGALGDLFGKGIKDIELAGNRPWSLVPAGAHALYVSFPKDTTPESVTTVLREHMDLASSSWLLPTVNAPPADPTTRGAHAPSPSAAVAGTD
jgi:hypothetical protein